jgi:hypothetical protein
MRKLILTFAIATLLVLVACQPRGAQQSLQGGDAQLEWSCVQYTCAEYGTGFQWAEANCQQTQNGTFCPIVQNGQEYAVPLDQINLTAITQSQSYCTQYRCVSEAPTRAVNYTVDEQQAQQSQGPTGQTTQGQTQGQAQQQTTGN